MDAKGHQAIHKCQIGKTYCISKEFIIALPVYGNADGEEKKLEDTAVDPIDHVSNVEEKIFNDQVAYAVRKAVSDLPERQRKAVEEHYLSGQTYNEIADQLHCSCIIQGRWFWKLLQKTSFEQSRSKRPSNPQTIMKRSIQNETKHNEHRRQGRGQHSRHL